jgi:hypothetical protein
MAVLRDKAACAGAQAADSQVPGIPFTSLSRQSITISVFIHWIN